MKTMSRICLFALLLSVGGTFTSCDFINEKRNQYFSSSNSNSLVGEWVEVSEDDYLVGHYQFYSDGSGKFWLTDGNTVRGRFSFTWKQNGKHVKIFSRNSSEELTFTNGVLIHGFGGFVYYKK